MWPVCCKTSKWLDNSWSEIFSNPQKSFRRFWSSYRALLQKDNLLTIVAPSTLTTSVLSTTTLPIVILYSTKLGPGNIISNLGWASHHWIATKPITELPDCRSDTLNNIFQRCVSCINGVVVSKITNGCFFYVAEEVIKAIKIIMVIKVLKIWNKILANHSQPILSKPCASYFENN